MDDGGSPLKQFKKSWKSFFHKGHNDNLEDVTEEEIISMVNEGHEQGVLLASEAEMIHNIFEFDDKDAKDIMIHRKNIAALDGSETFREMLAFIREQNYSRYPVYMDTIDNIIGVIHIKDILNQMLNGEILDSPIIDIPELIHEMAFIPETRSINVLFKGMQSKKAHMAIVVDEYGQTSGLVTMEDIIEEIMGNIMDEHDEEEPLIIAQGEHRFLMDGMAPLDEVFEALKIDPSLLDDEILEDYDTLNGYLISLIDKIPADGERFKLHALGYQFNVESVENKMIRKVLVTPEELLVSNAEK